MLNIFAREIILLHRLQDSFVERDTNGAVRMWTVVVFK